MSKMIHYDFKGQYGITDLLPESPYRGEWGIYSAHFGVKEVEYKKDPETYHKRIRDVNEKYLTELHASGKFGQEYTIGITLKHSPLFDDNKIPTATPLESHRIIFLNND